MPMYPVIFEIGGFTVTGYGLMVMIAFVVGAWLMGVQLERRALNKSFAWDVLVWTALGGMVGAKLYYLALHWQDVLANPLHELTNRAGLVWYGGLIGGVLAFLWYARRRGMPLLKTADAAAPSLAASYAIGRIGCFLVGENYGFPTDSWTGVAFPQGNPPTTAANLRAVGAEIPATVPDEAVLAVHPTQLYEFGLSGLIFVILWRVAGRALPPGRLFALYLALASLERFAMEFVRAKDDRFVYGLTTSQVFTLLGLGMAVWLWRRRPGDLGGGTADSAAEPSRIAPHQRGSGRPGMLWRRG